MAPSDGQRQGMIANFSTNLMTEQMQTIKVSSSKMKLEGVIVKK